MAEVTIEGTVLVVTPIQSSQGRAMVQITLGDPLKGPVTYPLEMDREVAGITIAVQKTLCHISARNGQRGCWNHHSSSENPTATARLWTTTWDAPTNRDINGRGIPRTGPPKISRPRYDNIEGSSLTFRQSTKSRHSVPEEPSSGVFSFSFQNIDVEILFCSMNSSENSSGCRWANSSATHHDHSLLTLRLN